MKRCFVKVLPFGAAVLALMALGACAVVSDAPELQVASLMNVAPEKTVVVGRIELQPPFQEGEQLLKPSRGDDFRNAFLLYAGDRLRDFKAKPPDGFDGSFLTALAKEFFIKVDKGRTLYISGGMFYTVYDPPFRTESQIYSLPFQVELKPDDEAVYIGTLLLIRDDKNKLESVMIRDDYQWADGKFKEHFGTRKTLRKALVAPVVCPAGN